MTERKERLQEEEEELSRLNSALTSDGHEIERIAPERWKAIMRLIHDSDEKEKWFENLLDNDLRTALRCTACGRTFLPVRAVDNFGAVLSYMVMDEEGDEVDPAIERPCLAKSGHVH